jgi:hypothetical protein
MTFQVKVTGSPGRISEGETSKDRMEMGTEVPAGAGVGTIEVGTLGVEVDVGRVEMGVGVLLGIGVFVSVGLGSGMLVGAGVGISVDVGISVACKV